MDKILDSDQLAQVGQELRQQLTASNQLVGDWVKRAAKALVEQMLEAEVDEALQRKNYQRRQEDQKGYRNGFKQRTIRTAEGKLAVDVPQVRDLGEEPYRSPIWQGLAKRSPALEKLAVEMYARGLSTRDIEQLLGDLCEQEQPDKTQTLLSKSSVSRVTEPGVLW